MGERWASRWNLAYVLHTNMVSKVFNKRLSRTCVSLLFEFHAFTLMPLEINPTSCNGKSYPSTCSQVRLLRCFHPRILKRLLIWDWSKTGIRRWSTTKYRWGVRENEREHGKVLAESRYIVNISTVTMTTWFSMQGRGKRSPFYCSILELSLCNWLLPLSYTLLFALHLFLPLFISLTFSLSSSTLENICLY